MVPAIAATGIRVVGNLAALTDPQPGRRGDEAAVEAVRVAPGVAAEMALGVLFASGMARADGASAATGPIWIEPIEVARVSTWQLAAVMARRVQGSVMRKVRGPRRRRTDPID